MDLGKQVSGVQGSGGREGVTRETPSCLCVGLTLVRRQKVVTPPDRRRHRKGAPE